MAKIFISYSRDDSEFADQCYEALTARAHEVWMDRAGLKGGDDWLGNIQDKIRWSDTVLVLWSATALESIWVRREITYAQTFNKRIIPVQIDNTSPQEHMIINALNVIDARHLDFTQVLDQLAQAIETGSASRSSGSRLSSPRGRRRRNQGWLIGGGAVLLAVAAVALVIMRPPPEPLTTPTPSQQAASATVTTPPDSITPTTDITPTTSLLELPADLDLLNQWRSDNDMAPLNLDTALQSVAAQHVSYLRSLPLQELESINVFRNADGQDVIFMAQEAGYNSEDITMIVEIRDDDYALQDLLNDLDDQAQYTDAGFEQVRSIATNKLYLVLILGAGGS